HDLSIMDHLIDEKPVAVAATGESHFGSLEDLAYITIFFGNRMIAHVNVNWLSPVKVRTTLIGGEKRMAVWNDLDADEKVKVYDKGVVIDDDQDQEGVYNLLVSYRSGDMYAPKVEQTEALKLEAQYFLDCICSGDAPINDGWAGLRVVRLLEAASESLKDRGRLVEL
ncbi:MAG: gfo/Idh/MocA family oxidoreductase, partial [Planctomycetes bacterium]|nr:gfo/Idh/MocA family oxidoreductase [Planctomycetota bacterium]